MTAIFSHPYWKTLASLRPHNWVTSALDFISTMHSSSPHTLHYRLVITQGHGHSPDTEERPPVPSVPVVLCVPHLDAAL